MPFDLLGDPVPANKGQRGRPQHAQDIEKFKSMVRCYGLGWSDARVAQAHGISIPTMKRHYFSTPDAKRARQHAMDLYEAAMISRLDEQSRAGKTSATVQLLKRFDKARLGDVASKPKPKKRKGLKEERRDSAWLAGQEDQDWGALIGPQTRAH